MEKQMELRDVVAPEPKSLYLAGPFFNDLQLRTIERVEEMCEEKKVVCNSPRKFLVLKPKASWEERKAVFLDNILKIQQSEIVLACLDNPWVDRITGELIPGNQAPDTGTIWEMGYAHAIGRPVVCFTANSARMNVMLAQGCNGFLKNLGEVSEFLKGKEIQAGAFGVWEFAWEVAEQWLAEIY
ncbi:nucleoside 2-deoxyribosyltransferase [Candidatus Parcubacteria bacterium]|nr:nucleoside 2-deoxyribosyltransferase [Candidatus Parcubacteria bacterium]